MTWKAIIVLFLLCLGVLGEAIYLEYNPPRDWYAPLFPEKPSQLMRICISDQNHQLYLSFHPSSWLIEDQEGHVALVDPEKLHQLLEVVFHLKALNRIPAEEVHRENNLIPFGLETPKRSVTFFFKNGKKEELFFGNEAVGKEQCFARLGGNHAIMVISTKMASLLFVPFSTWESHHLFPGSWEDLKEVHLSRPDGNLLLQKDDMGEWKMLQPIVAPVRKAFFRETIAPLLKASFITKRFVSHSWKEEISLDVPSPVSIELVTDEGKKWRLEMLHSSLSEVATEEFYEPQEEAVLTLSKTNLGFLSIMPDQLRSRKLWPIPAASMTSLEVFFSQLERKWTHQLRYSEYPYWKEEQPSANESGHQPEEPGTSPQEINLNQKTSFKDADFNQIFNIEIEEFLPASPKMMAFLEKQPKIILTAFGGDHSSSLSPLLEKITLIPIANSSFLTQEVGFSFPKRVSGPILIAKSSDQCELLLLPISYLALLEKLHLVDRII